MAHDPVELFYVGIGLFAVIVVGASIIATITGGKNDKKAS